MYIKKDKKYLWKYTLFLYLWGYKGLATVVLNLPNF